METSTRPRPDAVQPLGGAAAWSGTDMAKRDDWRLCLDGRETSAFAAGDMDALADLTAHVSDILEDGPGLVRISGFPVDRLSDEAASERLLAFARPVPQDEAGVVIHPIHDEGAAPIARHGALDEADGSRFLSSRARAQSGGPLRFHTDRADVVGLLTLRTAAEGGISRLASSVAIHDAMVARRPDLAERLYRPFPRSRLGDEGDGRQTVIDLPVFGARDGRFTSHFSRTYIEAADKLGQGRRLEPADWEALDLLAELAEELSFDMPLAVGDLQLLNCLVTYHGRTAYRDAPGGPGRCLLRVWLCPETCRALPSDHASWWGAIECGGLRGGIGRMGVG